MSFLMFLASLALANPPCPRGTVLAEVCCDRSGRPIVTCVDRRTRPGLAIPSPRPGPPAVDSTAQVEHRFSVWEAMNRDMDASRAAAKAAEAKLRDTEATLGLTQRKLAAVRIVLKETQERLAAEKKAHGETTREYKELTDFATKLDEQRKALENELKKLKEVK